jgi:hypothetical protein
MAMEIQVLVGPQVVIQTVTRVEQAVEAVVPVEVIIRMPLVVLVGIQMVLIVVMRMAGTVFPMVDKEVRVTLIKAPMADLAAAVDHTQALVVLVDIPVAVQEPGPNRAMAAEVAHTILVITRKIWPVPMKATAGLQSPLENQSSGFQLIAPPEPYPEVAVRI